MLWYLTHKIYPHRVPLYVVFDVPNADSLLWSFHLHAYYE
jgi:hypothetical protein